MYLCVYGGFLTAFSYTAQCHTGKRIDPPPHKGGPCLDLFVQNDLAQNHPKRLCVYVSFYLKFLSVSLCICYVYVCLLCVCVCGVCGVCAVCILCVCCVCAVYT